jgi:peptidoglycan hydrolase-like protein with peptidoglycan-binding domain
MRNIVAFCQIILLILLLSFPGIAQTASLEESPVEWRITENEVVAVQTELRRRGYYDSNPGGVLDRSTREAVRTYQADKGLKVTGRIDRPTYETLELAYPASGNERDSERLSGLLPSIGYGVKDKTRSTGRALDGTATKVKGKTVAGYEKTKSAGAGAVSKTKEVAQGVGSTTARGVRVIGRGVQRAGEMFMGRSDAAIQTDVRALLKSDSNTEKWYSEVRSGMVTIKTPNQHKADLGAVITDIRQIEGVRSVFVIAQ